MDALLEPVLGQPRDAEQLDAVAELLGEVDVEPGHRAGCPRHVCRRGRPGAESQAGQDRELVRGIDAVDVESGIGLGIAQLLRLGQHIGEARCALSRIVVRM